MATSARGLLTSESVIYKNLQCVAYKKTDQALEERVVSMTTIGNYILLGIAKHGCHVYSVQDDGVHKICVLGDESKKTGKKLKSGGSTAYNICCCTKRIIYINESEGQCCISVHHFKDIIAGRTAPIQSIDVQRRAPLVYDRHLELLAVGGGAWTSSWVGAKDDANSQGGGDRCLVTLNVEDLVTIKEWEAVANCVSLLRVQSSESQSILGVADTRNGLKVFNLKQPEDDGYSCLYYLPVEEVRNFQLVGDYVGVFHKFEPNVSFWNMKEQKTILCINIQEQMKQLAEEYYYDDDGDVNDLFDEEDDNVTAVSSVPFEEDHILIYGTRAGCIFGMAVNHRNKVFSIPYAHESDGGENTRNDVLGVSLLPDGKLIACYQGYGLTMLDFSPEDPPDRPPTRGQPK